MKNYFYSTKTAACGFLAAMPLLLAYESLILLVNSNNDLKVRIGADIWIKQFLSGMGVNGHLTLGLILLLIGGIIFFRERKNKIALKWKFFPVMILESLFYSIVLALIISRTVSYIFNFSLFFAPELLEVKSSGQGESFLLQITLSIGAGLYEELFFRVLLVSGLHFLFKSLIFSQKNTSYLAAALTAAILFSLVHYIGPFGDVLTLSSFTFRFLFGLAFNVLYVLRGFGIVTWTHALYDIILTVSLKA